MRRLIAILAVAAAVVGLLMEGCGGDDSADAQIDKTTFVKQANLICERASGKFAAQIASISGRESAKPGSTYAKTQMVLVREALIPLLDEEQQQIHALGMPDEAASEAEAFLKAFQRAVATAKAKVKAVSEGSLPFEPIELAGAKFGVSKCPVAATAG